MIYTVFKNKKIFFEGNGNTKGFYIKNVILYNYILVVSAAYLDLKLGYYRIKKYPDVKFGYKIFEI